MRLVVGLVLLSAAFAGCGGGDDRARISRLMDDLRSVQESGDAEKACEDVYVVRERGRDESEVDEGCREAFVQAAAGRDVTNLRTRLVRVEVAGEEGTAVLRTSATRPDGSVLDRDVPYDVVRTEEGWRVRIAGEG